MTTALEWSGGASAPAWPAFDATVGNVPSLRVLATLPTQTVQAAMQGARINPGGEERELTAVECAVVALTWRVARQKFGLPDIDPLAPAPLPPPASAATTTTATPPTGRKVKLSALIDQADEQEITAMTPAEVDMHFSSRMSPAGHH